MDANDVLLMLLGAVISAAIGWLFAWNSSRRIAKTLERLTVLMRGLESNGVITLTYDPEGNPKGVLIEASSATKITSSAIADPVVVKASEHSGPVGHR